VHGLQQN